MLMIFVVDLLIFSSCTESVGRAILEDMEGKAVHVDVYVFKKANQAVTLGCKSAIKVGGDLITADPQLLFQRLILVAKSRDSLKDVFRFELCHLLCNFFVKHTSLY